MPVKKKALKRRPKKKRQPARSQQLTNKLEAVRAIGKAMAAGLGLDTLLRQLVPNITQLLRATRSTLFFYDNESQELWSKVAQGQEEREIRLALGKGIAGWVATQKKSVNIKDAYADARFNSEVDARTGFRTRSVLACPVLGHNGQLVGVLQVLNHIDGTFSADDLGLLETIATQTAYAIENAHLAQTLLDQNKELESARHRAERRREELDLLYTLEQETSASGDLDTLLDSVILRACDKLRSQAGSVLLLEKDTGRLFFRGATGEKRDELKRLVLEPGQGIVGWVAQHGQSVIVNSPEEDPRHSKEIAKKLNVPAHALLAVPLFWDQRIIGAMEVLNPRATNTGVVAYDVEDLKVLTIIAGQVARAVSLTLEKQAKQDTERLSLIGRMLASVAHDLRNPMTVISGYAQIMAGEDSVDQRQLRCDRILQQIDEMTGMISDLLAFSRGDNTLRPTLISLAVLAQDVREVLQQPCNQRGIALTIDAPPNSVLIDAGRAKRIILNLAKNAVDVMSSGDKLDIELKDKEGGISMVIKDTGPGLPTSVQARLFEPFVTTGKPGGTGLGLSIVKRFVDDHAGAIRLESSENRGTSFFVYLPRASEISKDRRA